MMTGTKGYTYIYVLISTLLFILVMFITVLQIRGGEKTTTRGLP